MQYNTQQKREPIQSILGKRKYQAAMGYENEDPEIQQQKLDIKYEKIPNFSKELFETSDGLQQIADWFSGYNEYLQSKYFTNYIGRPNEAEGVQGNSRERSSSEFISLMSLDQDQDQ